MNLKNKYLLLLLAISAITSSYGLEQSIPKPSSSDIDMFGLLSQARPSFFPAQSTALVTGVVTERNFTQFCSKLSSEHQSEALIAQILFGQDPLALTPILHTFFYGEKHEEFSNGEGGSILSSQFKDYLNTYFSSNHQVNGLRFQHATFLSLVTFVEKITHTLMSYRNKSLSIEDMARKTKKALLAEIVSFKVDVLEHFLKKQGGKEESFKNIPICAALLKSNKYILADLLLAYGQILVRSSFNTPEFNQFKLVFDTYKPSHFANNNAPHASLQQFEINRGQLIASEQYEYLYLLADTQKEKKELVCEVIKNNALSCPIIACFLNAYSKEPKLTVAMVKEVLDCLLNHITLPGCQLLCSHAYGKTLSAALKVSRAIDPYYVAEFKKKVLFRDEHISKGNMSKGKPSGSHMLRNSNEEHLLDAKNSLVNELKNITGVTLETHRGCIKINQIFFDSLKPVLKKLVDRGIYNNKNGVIHCPVALEIEANCSFGLKVAQKKKFVPLNPLLESEFIESILSLISQKLKITDISNVVYGEDGMSLTCKTTTEKKMGSSYFSPKFNDDESLVFALIEKAYLARPEALRDMTVCGENIKIIGKNSGRKIARVADGDGCEHVIEMYIDEYFHDQSILSIVTAFEHFAGIEINNPKSYPTSISDNDKISYELPSANYKELNRALGLAVVKIFKSLLVRDNTLFDKAKPLYIDPSACGCYNDLEDNSLYVQTLDNKIAQHYKDVPPALHSHMIPLLVKVSKELVHRNVEDMLNANILEVSLAQTGSPSASIRVISNTKYDNHPKYKLTKSLAFADTIRLALVNILKNKDLIIDATHDGDCVRIILSFDIAHHFEPRAKALAHDRLALIVPYAYLARLASEENIKHHGLLKK